MKELLMNYLPEIISVLLVMGWAAYGVYVKKTESKKDDERYEKINSIVKLGLSAFMKVENTGIIAKANNAKINKVTKGVVEFNKLYNAEIGGKPNEKDLSLVQSIYSVASTELKSNPELVEKLKSDVIDALKKTKD